MGENGGPASQLIGAFPGDASLNADHLRIRQDLHIFRSVCRKWRYSFLYLLRNPREPPNLCLLFPLEFPDVPGPSNDRLLDTDPSDDDEPLFSGDLFSVIAYHFPLHLVANAVYLLKPPKNSDSLEPWIVTVEEFNMDYKVNCIICHKDCFPLYKGASSDESFFEGASKELEIGVFYLRDGDTGLISAYPGYSDILWPPPTWLHLTPSPEEGDP